MPFTPTIPEAPTAPEVRTLLREAGDYLLGLRRTPADQRGDGFAEDVRSATAFIHEFDAVLTATERSQAPEARGPQAAFGLVGERRDARAGEVAVSAEEYRSWVDRGGDWGSFPAIELRGGLNGIEFRALIDSTTDGSASDAGVFLPQGQPIAPVPRQRRLFVRDLLSVQQTGLASVPYIRELTPATNETGATAVAEGGAKPEVTMEFEAADAPIRKIAAWVPVTMEILQDAPTLAGYINTRLAYMLAVREEAQILAGPGTAPNLRGITETTGTQTQAAVNDDLPATVGLAIAKIENVDGDADGVAMNPLDFWSGVVERHANQMDGDGSVGIPYGRPPAGPWGLPTVRTRSLSQGSAIVGAWRLGATLFDRMRTTIRTSDSHDDYFIKNKSVVLAEERVGLAVHRPDFFVETTLTFT